MENILPSEERQNVIQKALNSLVTVRKKHYEKKLAEWRKKHEEEYKVFLEEIEKGINSN